MKMKKKKSTKEKNEQRKKNREKKHENNIPNIAPIDANVYFLTHFSAHAAVRHKFNLIHETINYHHFTEAKKGENNTLLTEFVECFLYRPKE